MKALVIIITLFCAGLVLAVETQQYEKPDPTKNVMQLVEAAVKRLDDINVIQKKAMEDRIEQHYMALNERLNMFMSTAKELASAEKSRVDAIRAFDANASQIDRERATTQARVLAEQVESSRENLRLLVATTAESTAKQNQAIISDLAKTIADLAKRITDLEKVQNASAGASGGIKDLWPIIFGIVMTLIAIAAFIVPKLKAEPNGRTKREIES